LPSREIPKRQTFKRLIGKRGREMRMRKRRKGKGKKEKVRKRGRQGLQEDSRGDV